MIGGEVALRVQPLPDVIDLSIILTGSGLGGLVGAVIGALRRGDRDSIARSSLTGTMLAELQRRSGSSRF